MMGETRSRARIVALFPGAAAAGDALGAGAWRKGYVQALDGMGPGQSISCNIVQSLGGGTRAPNGSDGGAILTVELERRAQAGQAE